MCVAVAGGAQKVLGNSIMWCMLICRSGWSMKTAENLWFISMTTCVRVLRKELVADFYGGFVYSEFAKEEFAMMVRNYEYYRRYVMPDMLILNAL